MLLLEGLYNIGYGLVLLLIANFHWLWVPAFFIKDLFPKPKAPITVYFITPKSYVIVKDGKATLKFVKKRKWPVENSK